METKKRYYDDCHLQRFSARVVACGAVPEGYRIVLEETAFYPEGGGQACDLGTLGGARVLDVQQEAGTVVHLCDRPLPVGETVTGQIDASRRFDQMQQHSGEHIVSGIIHRRYGYANVGFHVGAEVMTIDFSGPVPPEALEEIEREANRVVWANLPVRGWYPTQQELERMAYRSKRQLEGAVRIVEIPGVDCCACCGVHVAATGEIGVIKLLSMVKFHSGVRLELVCGGRALEYVQSLYRQNRKIGQLLSAPMAQTAEAVEQLAARLEQQRERTVALRRQMLRATAARCAGLGDVLCLCPEADGGLLQELTQRMAECCGGAAAGFCATPGGQRFCLFDPEGKLGKQLLSRLHGRGGGRDGWVHGSVQATWEAVLTFFVREHGFTFVKYAE